MRAQTVRVPRGLSLGLVAVALTFLQWAPLTAPVVELVAPRLSGLTELALAGTETPTWGRISILPGATGLEVARLTSLCALFLASAQFSWRLIGGLVALAGTCVTLVGLGQSAVGASRIYGVYEPLDRAISAQDHGMLTSFVNPNHQAMLMVLGFFCALALAIERRSTRAREGKRGPSLGTMDVRLAATAAACLQAAGIILSMSRAAFLAWLLVSLVAFVLSWRGRAGSSMKMRKLRPLALPGLGLLAVLATVVIVGNRGMWAEIALLTDPSSTELKLHTVRDSVPLIWLSPILGTGRGTFIDLFPSVDAHASAKLVTHLESAPLVMLVEWGLLFGAVALVAVVVWWLKAFRSSGSVARKIALCGLLAVALQSLGDFGLEFLGVAAPACAVAGSLGPARPLRIRLRWVSAMGLVTALGGGLIAANSLTGNWSGTRADHEKVAAGDFSLDEALKRRPLNPLVHLAAARTAAKSGDWVATKQRAEVAARLRPSLVDPHLVLAACGFANDDRESALAAVRTAVARLRAPASRDLVEYLAANLSPAEMTRVAPDDAFEWRLLERGLIRWAPSHADQVAAARQAKLPNDPEPLRFRVKAAISLGRPALAMHHGRLLVQLAPSDADSHVIMGDAWRVSGPDGERELQEALEKILAEESVDDPGKIEEGLVRSYLRTGAAKEAARHLESLLARPAESATRERRRSLAVEVARSHLHRDQSGRGR
jgi:hypothetical protein